MSRLQRLFNRPLEVALALVALRIGLLFLEGQIHPHANVAKSLDDLAPWMRWGVAIFLVLGSAAWLWTRIHWFKLESTLRAVQRTGAFFMAVGFLSYSGALWIANPGARTTWWAYCGIGLGWLALSVRSVMRERQVRRDRGDRVE